MKEYNFVTIKELPDLINREVDLFICSSSFESRCLTIPDALKSLNFTNSAICHYQNSYDSANEFCVALGKILRDPQIVHFEKDNPLENLDNIVALIQYLFESSPRKNPFSIILDITTFTHEMILVFLYLFRFHFTFPNFKVTIVYSPASDYSLDQKSENDKWLSRGVGDIRTVLGYAGAIIPSKRNLLVILVGFEEERAKSLVELFEPSKVLLGHASKEGAISSALLAKNISTFEHLRDQITSSLDISVDTFEFTCKRPSEVEVVLEKISEEFGGEYNIIISCLNNKISTLGCAFFGLKHQEIQLCYASATQYNYLNYSTPGNQAFTIDLF